MNSLTTRYRIHTSDVDIRKRYKAFSFMSQTQEIANYHASEIGFGYQDLIKNNVVWVLSRMRARFLNAPMWEDEVDLTTWHKGREGVFSFRDFELTSAAGGPVLVQATSSWLLIDTESRRMLRPDHILGDKSITTALDRDAIAEHCGKLAAPKGMEKARTREVLFSDVDFNGHTNNAKYVEWAFDTLDPQLLTAMTLDEYQINFNHETRLGDMVEIFRADTGDGSWFLEGRSQDKSVFQMTVRLKP